MNIDVQAFGQRVQDNVGRVIIGKENITEMLLVALLCEGHVLLEDVPGTGKTTIAKALAHSLQLDYRRLQFTPDLLPSDVTGLFFFNQKTQDFQFRPGPVHTNILLADEINRATPRTQSALLEAMQERQVTVEGVTHALPHPFFVLATQNPIELEGTFPLPEAQLDRFLLKLDVGYPNAAEEENIVRQVSWHDPVSALQPVASPAEIETARQIVQAVRVEPAVRRYLVAVVRATRENEAVDLGASPRASIALYQAAQALAALRGRDFVIPDDVKALVPYVLIHRIHISPHTRLRGRTSPEVIQDVVESVPVPVAK